MSALGRESELEGREMCSSLMQLLVLLNNLFKKRETQLLTARSKGFFPLPWDPFSSLVEVWKKGSQSNDIASAFSPR